MTRSLLAFVLLFVLPLALRGCVDPNLCEGRPCSDDDDTVGNDDDDAVDFNAQLHVVIPYGWTGIIGVFEGENDPDNFIAGHTNVQECDVDVQASGAYTVNMIQHGVFQCVPQDVLVEPSHNGGTIEVENAWLGEGACGLAPEGEDGGWDVDTSVGDQVWITIDNYNAVVTEDTFFYEDDEYLLEGTITLLEESFEVYFHRVLETGETERTLNIPLED